MSDEHRNDMDIEKICQELIEVVLERQAALEEDGEEEVVLVLDFAVVPLLAMLPIHVWAIQQLAPDTKDEEGAYAGATQLVRDILTRVIDGIVNTGDSFQKFEFIARMREAGVPISGVKIGNEDIDIPAMDQEV